MIYPEFLKENDLIGVTAPSAGLDEGHLVGYLKSLEHFHARGWQVTETANVRLPDMPSSSGAQRAKELKGLSQDSRVKMIWCAAGGDFLVEMLPYTDFEGLKANPKWVQGYSDPTGLLFPITTKYDVATIYGPNAGGFDMETLHPALETSLDILSGKLPVQRSFERWQPFDAASRPDGGYNLTRPVCWQTPCGPIDQTGRLLGGCLDVIDILRGTDFIDVPGFVKRYENDGIIWYFDIFAMTAEQVFYSLWSMKQAGWFRTAKAILLGRVMFPGGMMLSYEQAVRRALGDLPLALEADIGHVKPCFTLINGALGHITVENGRAALEMELK